MEKYSSNIATVLVQISSTWNSISIILQTPLETIALNDLAQAQPDKSKIYTQKNDSANSPVPELLTKNALKGKLCDSPKNDSPSYILDVGQSKPVKSKLCVTTCKSHSGLLNILYPAQSKVVKRKVSDPAKNAKKPIIYCGSCENILNDKPRVYQDFCVAYDICDVWFHYKCIGIPREKEVNNDAWLCSTCEKLDTTLK